MNLANIAIKISSLSSVDQGNVIKEARKKHGLTQTQLAELISQSTSAEAVDVKKVSKWETGKIAKIEPENKSAIYEILGLNASDFFTYGLQLERSEEYIDDLEIQDAIEFLDFIISDIRTRKSKNLKVGQLKAEEHLKFTKTTLREHLFQFLKDRERIVEENK